MKSSLFAVAYFSDTMVHNLYLDTEMIASSQYSKSAIIIQG